MIHCILLNPSIDNILNIDNFTVNNTFKVDETYEFPVGKAISVAIALKILQKPVKVISLVGNNEIQKYNEFLNSKNIPHLLIPVKGKTRSNITIIDSLNNQCTHLRYRGFQVSEKDLLQIDQYLETEVKLDDYVIFSGSLPKGASINYFHRPSEIIKKKKAKLIIDTSGDRLKLLKKYNPFLIKMNLKEMECILDTNLCEDQELSNTPSHKELNDLFEKCKKLTGFNTKYNILTLGEYGSIIFNNDESYHASVILDSSPYTVGCGDAFLAGLVSAIMEDKSMEYCIKFATACGASNIQTLGPGIFKIADVKKIFPNVQIQKIN